MVYRLIFVTESEAWEFAKTIVVNGGVVHDYGATNDEYYIQYSGGTKNEN